MSINKRFDYLAPAAPRWGIHLCGAGMRITPPHTPYQVFEEGAPYQWTRGRVLRDYSVVYVTQGQGVFQVRGSRPRAIRAGDVLLIRPGVWHNYAPDKDTGWKEFWVMFNGREAGKLVSHPRRRSQPSLIPVGDDKPLHHLFTQMLDTAAEAPPFADAIHAGLLLQMGALIQSRLQLRREQGNRDESFIRRAKQQLAAACSQPVDMHAIARSLGVSYPHFRRVFKISTGLPPWQYLLHLRLNLAKRLMEESDMKLSEVARQAGFEDPYHFSRLFKRKTGVSPSRWRH